MGAQILRSLPVALLIPPEHKVLCQQRDLHAARRQATRCLLHGQARYALAHLVDSALFQVSQCRDRVPALQPGKVLLVRLPLSGGLRWGVPVHCSSSNGRAAAGLKSLLGACSLSGWTVHAPCRVLGLKETVCVGLCSSCAVRKTCGRP